METGWIKLHRKITESSVWKDPETIATWIWCLTKATHKDYKFPFNGGDIEIKSGQFITGLFVACKEIKVSPRKYRTCIAYLQNTGRITVKSTNKFTLISVLKWEKYQDSDKRLTNERQTTDNIQEHKEHKEIRKRLKNGEETVLKDGLRVKKAFGKIVTVETNCDVSERDYPEIKYLT